MRSLGSLGKVREPEVVDETTFDWFGQTVRLPPLTVSQLELVDMAEKMQATDENDPGALAVIKDLFRLVIHQDDFVKFWVSAIQHRQSVEDMMQVYSVLIEVATNRPTRRPSDSSDGPLATPTNSTPASSSPEPQPGRPDLVLLMEGGEQTRAQLAAAVAG